jgi:hypothetical protein
MRFTGASEPMLLSDYREMTICTLALVPQAIFCLMEG